ncbi:MAG: PorP/SprF family type IX secretion system membrane protein [Cytophagaceae bacterium]|nr:PorP/SprF family type IX secretion system membrane protein [Cytophagaceae bacterium]
MKAHLRSILLTTAAILLPAVAFSQQYPSVGFFTNTQLFFNPAYAGSGEGIRATGLYRAQWTGVAGAPQTQIVAFDGPLGRGIGLGATVSRDKFFSYSQVDIMPSVSYRVNVGPETYVQAGLRAGVSIVNFGNDVFQWQADDPLKNNESRNGVVPRIGAGLFLKAPKYFVGLSAPDLVNIDSKKIFYDNSTGKKTIKTNYFLTAGARLDVSEYITFVPNVLVRAYANRPLYASVNAGFEFNQTVLFGVGYIYSNGFAAYTMIGFTPKIKAGYRFEYSPSDNNIGKYTTNEIVISYGIQ